MKNIYFLAAFITIMSIAIVTSPDIKVEYITLKARDGHQRWQTMIQMCDYPIEFKRPKGKTFSVGDSITIKCVSKNYNNSVYSTHIYISDIDNVLHIADGPYYKGEGITFEELKTIVSEPVKVGRVGTYNKQDR